jgi:hypothetical protein
LQPTIPQQRQTVGAPLPSVLIILSLARAGAPATTTIDRPLLPSPVAEGSAGFHPVAAHAREMQQVLEPRGDSQRTPMPYVPYEVRLHLRQG